ncbi:MAG: rod shape-determining protein MreC [Bacteroidales bacterium]|nr:rod shape-determining protein MreC [Bacteroidales bacterium]
MEIAAIVLLTHTRSMQDIWLNKASHRVLGALWKSGESVRNYFSLGEQNRILAAENLALSVQLREYAQEDLAKRMNPMRDSISGSFRYIPASIVKASRNSQHNYIILNKGSEDGVKPQTGIITTHGVVGVVQAVDKHYSYGLSLMNTMLSVSARIGHTGLVAPLEWDGRRSDGAIMRNLPLHQAITPGDTVWTSGFSSVFPADIPIGTTGKVRMVDGSMNEAEVNLFQDFGAMRYVIITENIDKDEISGLEKAAAK